MGEKLLHVSVCICTYKRPELLRLLLNKICEQETDGAFNYSIVVADNDSDETARRVVEEFTNNGIMKIIYCVEPRKNIALVRNKVVQNASGDFLAFIDDDELPENDWLKTLFETIIKYKVDAVLAPVRTRFEHEPPGWVKKGKFFQRPEFPTGSIMKYKNCRTGNVFLKKQSIECLGTPFDERFGSGSEDVDFFRRLIACGKTVIWCNEAPVFELVTKARCKRRYQIRLAFLRGANSFKHSGSRFQGVVKAIIAIPLYCLALPVFYIIGEHFFMKYLIKCCDHLGRLLSSIGIVIVRERAL